MFFKTVDTRQWRTVIPERQETNEVSPTIFTARCFKSFFRLQRRWEPRQIPENSLGSGDGAESSWKPRWLEFTKSFWRSRELQIELWRSTEGPLQVISRTLIRVCVWRIYLSRGWEEHLKGLENSGQHTQRPGNSDCSHIKNKNLINYWAMGRVFGKVLLSNMIY